MNRSVLRRRPRSVVWCDAVWPVLAGVLTAAGVVGLVQAYGAVGLVALFFGMWLLLSVSIYGALVDNGLAAIQAVRYGRTGAVALVVAIGLLTAFPLAGWLALAIGGASCPPVVQWLTRRRFRRGAAAAVVGGPGEYRDRDQDLVDRTFSEIVRGFGADD